MLGTIARVVFWFTIGLPVLIVLFIFLPGKITGRFFGKLAENAGDSLGDRLFGPPRQEFIHTHRRENGRRGRRW